MKKSKYLIPVLLLMFAGCFTIPQETIEVHQYILESKNDTTICDTTLNISLKIDSFTADALYKGKRIIYKDRDDKTGYYYYHRWLAPPESQLADMLADDLSEWGMFEGGVFRTSTGLAP